MHAFAVNPWVRWLLYHLAHGMATSFQMARDVLDGWADTAPQRQLYHLLWLAPLLSSLEFPLCWFPILPFSFVSGLSLS